MHAKLALKVYLHQVIWGTKVIWCQIWVVFELIVLGKLVQIASGRRRQATCALHRSTGAAAASANLPTGSRKSISAAARVRTQSGMQSSEPKIFHRNYTRLQGLHIYRHIEKPWLNRVWHRRWWPDSSLFCMLTTRWGVLEIERGMCTQVCMIVVDRGGFFGCFGFLGIGLL